MRRFVPGVVLAVVSVVLSGCTAEAPAAPASDAPHASPPASAVGAATGPEVWGSVSLWVSPEGEVTVCQVPFTDGGWGEPSVCDDGLRVEGDGVTELSESAPRGRWSWSSHAITGHVEGARFRLTGIDTAEAIALQDAASAPPVPSEPQPSYSTDEEKSAALFAQADPEQYGCAEPEGGWRDAGDLEGLIGPYTAGYPGQVVGWAPLYVADGVSVALIGAAAEADLGAVRTGMQKLFPDAACIVTSSVSAIELQSALDEPLFGPDPVLIRTGSDAAGRTTADPYLAIFRAAPSDELDAAIARYPAGMVHLWTWFHRLP
ncbi:hypothetical protein [Herbiconiux sp. VKM Ac-2851]|uniref:hypothetical protein n=1 Tax=Herbiconiux sp. VKM Ac-2851 TaxID=2739025 RepID=UPI001566D307|nr:hypothetical protein [Herbiconiux sp. VKM Ac-2851]NQX33794.1 hypothetical protein [Herbiconiux sp. VKM Ac-2851]